MRKEIDTPASNINADIAEQNREIIQLNQERRELSDRLVTAEAEAKSSTKRTSKFEAEAESYRKNYQALLADYNYTEDLYYRLHKLFKRSMQEVYRAMSELREPRLRPKAPEGCLNCCVSGHSYRSCAKDYSGLFCQICSHPDFSTEDCPWPHYTELPKSLPDHLRCKCCWRPRNMPDPNCYDCRKRMMSENIALLPPPIPEKPFEKVDNAPPQKEESLTLNTCAQEAKFLGSEALQKLSLHASDVANATLWQSLAQAYSLVVNKNDNDSEEEDGDEKE